MTKKTLDPFIEGLVTDSLISNLIWNNIMKNEVHLIDLWRERK